MRPSNNDERVLALVPTDNCSVADTSLDDRTLNSFVDNASEKHPEKEKRSSRESSPTIKHKGLSTGVSTPIENWRPHVSTVAEKSTGSCSTDSMGDKPPDSAGIKGKSPVKPNASDLGSLRRRRPGASYGGDTLASVQSHLIGGRAASQMSSTAITSSADDSGDVSSHHDFVVPSDLDAETEAYFHSVSGLPMLYAPNYALNDDNSLHLSTSAQNTNFSFPTRARLPLYSTFRGAPHMAGPRDSQDTQDSMDTQDTQSTFPELDNLPSTLRALVRKNLRPEAGEKGQAAAAIILECFSGHKQFDKFELPSRSRLPPYASAQLETPHQETGDNDDDDDLEYAEGTDGEFSFTNRARLPLHMIAGAEARQMSSIANAEKCQRDIRTHHSTHRSKPRAGSFEFKQKPVLPSFSSFFKGPIETSKLGTQLARKGHPLQISETGKKGHVIGSIDSVGEYIRPNADSRLLFSITPFTKSEVQAARKNKDVIFGKLEKTWRRQEPVEESSRTATSNRSTNGTTETCARASSLRGGKGSSSSSCTSGSGRDNITTSSSYHTTAASTPGDDPKCVPSISAPPPTREASRAAQSTDSQTEDRNRFDALVNRLQQKLSERSEAGVRVNNTDTAKAKNEPRGRHVSLRVQMLSENGRHGRLVVHGSHQADGSVEGKEGHFPNQDAASDTKMNTNGPGSRLKSTDAPIVEPKHDGGPPVKNDQSLASVPVIKEPTGEVPQSLPPRPKLAPTSAPAEMNPYLPPTALQSGSWMNPSLPPFLPSYPTIAYPSIPPPGLGQQSTNMMMRPPPGLRPALGLRPPPGLWPPQHYPYTPAQTCPQAQIQDQSQDPASGPRLAPPNPIPPPRPPPPPPVPRLATIISEPPIPIPPVPPPPPPPAPGFAATISVPQAPRPGDTVSRWPISKRVTRKRGIPFVPLNASEQQKIEEHIELLKATIPNFATLSKRRQKIRWGRQMERQNYPQLDSSRPWMNSRGPHQQNSQQKQSARQEQSQKSQESQESQESLRGLHPKKILAGQPHQMQLPQIPQMQQMQQMQQMTPDQQCYQLGSTLLPPQIMQPMQPLQPYFPFAQYYPSNLGMSTWPLPLMNMPM